MSRKIASMLVALSFVFVGASAALAQVKEKPAVTPIPGGPVVPKCPQGWHVQPGSTESGGKMFACVPNKPKEKIKCAPNFEYWEKECAFGCKPMIK